MATPDMPINNKTPDANRMLTSEVQLMSGYRTSATVLLY
jgi:hypothetical protein